jgi:hypothetical protein
LLRSLARSVSISVGVAAFFLDFLLFALMLGGNGSAKALWAERAASDIRPGRLAT